MAFIKERLRRFETDEDKAKKDTEEAVKSEAKEDDAINGAHDARAGGAARSGAGSQSNGSNDPAAPRSYRSQIDYLFLIWKALDFE